MLIVTFDKNRIINHLTIKAKFALSTDMAVKQATWKLKQDFFVNIIKSLKKASILLIISNISLS